MIIYLTKQTVVPTCASEEAGAEIEVTPEMIDAVARKLVDFETSAESYRECAEVILRLVVAIKNSGARAE